LLLFFITALCEKTQINPTTYYTYGNKKKQTQTFPYYNYGQQEKNELTSTTYSTYDNTKKRITIKTFIVDVINGCHNNSRDVKGR
jgi:hypothetical protein